jgi:hypothetical protein
VRGTHLTGLGHALSHRCGHCLVAVHPSRELNDVTESTSASRSIERISIGELELPVRCTDGSALALMYRVELAAARDVLASETLEPLPVGGKALVQLTALEYRETSVGPYNELGVLVLARQRGRVPSTMRALVSPASVEDAGWYVVNQPVTTGFTCAAGRELWGLPRYLTRIDTEFTRDAAIVILGEELVIEHRARFGVKMPAPSYVFLSELEDHVIRTVVPVSHWLAVGGARSVRVYVTSDGPTAATTRRLGLEARRPMLAARTDHVNFTLPLGTRVGFAPLRIA